MASFYNNYYRYYNFRNLPKPNKPCPDKDASQETDSHKKSSKYYSFGPINFKNPLFNDIEDPVFEILGIELYLDDIIILGLLFFLYQEGVQDEMLYISLILLLLS